MSSSASKETTQAQRIPSPKKPRQIALSAGAIYGDWTLENFLGRGGNGHVWKARNSDGQVAALKILTKNKRIAKQRFRDEVKVMQSCGISRVVPVIDARLPEVDSEEPSWYAMPVGTPLLKFVPTLSLREVVEHFTSLASVLVELHEKDITHRDLKPANILFMDGEIHLGDFGLVDFPEKEDLTGNQERLGPRWTMAPEVMRSKTNQEMKPADVYSLAKCLWIAITGTEDGFEGRYDPASTTTSIRHYGSESLIEPLEQLLGDATEHDPAKRPTAREFHELLLEWLRVQSDFELSAPAAWSIAQTTIFPVSTPTSAKWTNLQDIVAVLNSIGVKTDINHMFFPNGGGLDLERARVSDVETGCIEITANGLTSLCKPKELSFESFPNLPEWAYFRLDCEELEPSGVYEEDDEFDHEEVTDVGDGKYLDLSVWEAGEYNGEPLPEKSRTLTRHFRGSFVLVQKASLYNRISATYDARHSRMSAKQFRDYIEHLIDTSSR